MGPKSGFIVVVDCNGDPQKVFKDNTSIDEVFQMIHILDKNSDYHPHSAWMWVTGGFSRVFNKN